MRNKLRSFSIVLLFNLISLSLIFSVALYRTDIVFAQDNANDAAIVPRDSTTDDDDDADDDDGDGDGDDDDDAQIIVYVVKPGDTLLKIARQLDIPYQVLAAQTNTPSRIFSGQVFTYSASDVNGSAETVASSAVSASIGSAGANGLQTYEFTVRQGDTLSHIAIWLGTTVEDLVEQVGDPRSLQVGQKLLYQKERQVDTPPLVTDNDGTDSDGYDTTGNLTDNDGTDSDGIDTQIVGTGNAAQANAQQANQQQNQPHTDNDGYDTTGNLTDNDGTDSDGYDTTGNLTDNDGTDSDGYDTTGNLTDNDGTDSDGYDTTGNLTDNDGTDSDGYDTTGNLPDSDLDSDDSDDDDS